MNSTKILKVISVTLSLLSVLSIVYVDTQIAIRYAQADSKTKALFGLVELGQFGFKYWILIPAIFSILVSVMIILRREFKVWDVLSIFVSLVSIVMTLTSSWKWLI